VHHARARALAVAGRRYDASETSVPRYAGHLTVGRGRAGPLYIREWVR
jgi:hypothetical protein